jgi:2-polyprenyl-3-methyl-5-hydroxy-6-metoxy-1,4-benzoquinol methylase
VGVVRRSAVSGLGALARRLRGALVPRRAPRAGTFQPYNHTLPDRYPWLFRAAALALAGAEHPRLLSFGCSRGDEVLSLRGYFPGAAIRGLDVDPHNISACLARLPPGTPGVSFATGATTAAEPDASYDAIFCLAVLVHGDLAVGAATRSDPLLRFADFERVITDFHRCLKPGGLLFLHTTNFRFCDTRIAAQFDVVLAAPPEAMSVDAKFDRDNRLLQNAQYFDVGFRKR